MINILQNASAHQKQLVSIGGKDYLFLVGNANEPTFIDDKSGVELFVFTPTNKTDPTNSDPNSTKPIQGLEKTLKVEVSAGSKKKVLDFNPVDKDPGHYTATFFPTVQTTYNYRVFGNVSSVPLSLNWTCSPGSVSEDTIISNSSMKISDGVERKAVVGGFPCPEPRSTTSFPEPYTSNTDMNSKISILEKEISPLNHNMINTTTLSKPNVK
ncbi:MAG: hypothetical protein M3Z01_02875 [Thermoproteota archaeon]|nr:hypothetical protein [Thermoproteota archaeon]